MSEVAPSTAQPQAAGSKPACAVPPQFALAHHEGDTVLLQLPFDNVDSVAFQLIPEGAPALTPFAELLQACDAALQVSTNSSKIARTRGWALITGHPISHAVANVCVVED